MNTSLEDFMLQKRVRRLRQVVQNRTRNLCVVVDGVHDPHNLSATVRSCDAFGILDLHVVESQARFRVSHKVSQGTQKWLDIHRWPNPEDCAEKLHQSGFQLFVADVNTESQSIDHLPFGEKLALVFGNEHQGASAHMRQVADGSFHIPMFGFAESLNISVSVGISLAIAVRERVRILGQHGDLSEQQQQRLIEDWQKRSVRCSNLILARLEQDKS